MRLINADNLDCTNLPKKLYPHLQAILDFIDSQTTVEERKVGKWIYKKLGVRTFGIVCSNCNKVYYEGQNVGSLEEFKKDIERIMRERNVTLDEYCCHCGAKMVGDETKYDCVKCKHDGFICDECENGSKYEEMRGSENGKK